jgi:hypothetical protein
MVDKITGLDLKNWLEWMQEREWSRKLRDDRKIVKKYDVENAPHIRHPHDQSQGGSACTAVNDWPQF